MNINYQYFLAFSLELCYDERINKIQIVKILAKLAFFHKITETILNSVFLSVGFDEKAQRKGLVCV